MINAKRKTPDAERLMQKWTMQKAGIAPGNSGLINMM